MKIAKVGNGAAVGGVLGLVGTFVVMNLVGYLRSKNNPYNDQGYVTQLFF